MTLKQLAKELGVSISTVSCALRGKANISEATRRKVIDAARELGYVPSVAARELRGQGVQRVEECETFNMVFMLCDSPQYDPVYGRMILGATNRISELGHHSIVCNVGKMQSTGLPPQLNHDACDGVILTGRIPEMLPGLIAANGYPLVILGNYELAEPYSNVSLDVQALICGLLQRCYEDGHRRIAFLTKDCRIPFEKACQQAYVEWMKSHDLWDPSLVDSLEDTYGLPADQVRRFQELPDPPTCIVTHDLDLAKMVKDELIVHYSQQAAKTSLACPIMNNQTPPRGIDCAVVDYSAMGTAAVMMLAEMLRNPELPMQKQMFTARFA